MKRIAVDVDVQAIIDGLRDKIVSDVRVQAKATSVAMGIFYRAHAAMMKDFLNNSITQELKAGKNASNISGTLDGEGNLFSFLGFFETQDPTWELEELLQKMTLKKTRVTKDIIFFKVMNVPSKEQISSATQMTWGNGTSWAYAVENGDFNGDAALSHFIFKSWDSSRSGGGFQVKGYEYSEDKFTPRPYISEILKNFGERMNNSSSRFLI